MSPRPLTEFAIDRLVRREITWIKTAELYLWTNRFSDAPRVSSLFLSDATRYLPAATVVDPLLTLGHLDADGEGWITPAGWEGLTVVIEPGPGRHQLAAISVNAGGGAQGGNLQSVGTTEMFGAVTLDVWPVRSDAVHRYVGVLLCSQLDGTSYYACLAEYGPTAGVFMTTIARYAASTWTNLLQVPTAAPSWMTKRLYAETRQVATGLQLTIRCDGPAGPIFAQVVDPTPLTGGYAGPTLVVGTGGNPTFDVRARAPMVGVSRREYLGAVLRWGQMGDALEATKPASAATSVDLQVSDALPMLTRELAPSEGTIRVYDRLSAVVNSGGVDGIDIGASGLFIRWVPEGGILGASNYRLDSPLQSADDVLPYVGAFDAWAATDQDVVTLQSTSPEGGATYVRVDQAAVEPTPVGLVSPIDWRNGFEEGALAIHAVADVASVWTTVNVGTFDTGPTGVVIIPGFHGASQYAVRFTSVASNNPGGATLSKRFAPFSTGSLYGRGYYRPVVTPSGGGGGGPEKIVEIATTGAPSLQIHWLPSGQYRLTNVGQSTTMTSTYPMAAGDRLEWGATRGGTTPGVEARIFPGDSRVPRESLVLPGDPGGSIQDVHFLCNGGAGHTGSYDLDDVGISSAGWLGPGCQIIAVPTTAVSTQWVPSSGTNVSCIDDHPGPLDDTNYISTATAGATDSYRWTIPAAAAVPDDALFYRATLYLRGRTLAGTTKSVLPIIWDELGNVANGAPWPITTSGTLNPSAEQYTVFAPGGRGLAQLQQWRIGLQCLTGGTDTLQITVLYGMLEYLTG